MELSSLLEDFKEIKGKIRTNGGSAGSSKFGLDGITMAIAYSDLIENITAALFDLTGQQVGVSEGIGLFLYGSPGRREMVCESDLDVMIIHRDDSKKYAMFKKRFKELVEPFAFCKIDLPEWGTLDEAAIFAEKSITEGNQVLEGRFVCGDSEIRKSMEEIQETFGGEERMTRNIVFQKFYFEQYFKQRVRDGAVNVKYCDGGSRDFLFIHWFNQLMSKKHEGWDKSPEKRPVAERGLFNLQQNGLVTAQEFNKSIDALGFNLLFRNEILLANKGTADEGLTFLDKRTLDNVFARMPEFVKSYNIQSPEDLARQFNTQRAYIARIKERIWNWMIEERGMKRGESWIKDFHTAYSSPALDTLDSVDSGDLLTRIAMIWGASNSNQAPLFYKICERERDSTSWEIQASLTTSPLCPPEHLHYIGTGLGKQIGYGYILRIIGRNPNVRLETLEAIAHDPDVEPRYSQCAKAALTHGLSAANHQI